MKLLKYYVTLLIIFLCTKARAQQIETMFGTERLFFDIQWFEKFDEKGKFTMFSRTRGTLDYDGENTDLFSGAYFGYNTKSGFGATFFARAASRGSGLEFGLHYFKNIKNVSIFAIASAQPYSEFNYSWFSIIRYTPSLSNHWKLYTSLELFSNFNTEGHVVSVQRIRTGLNFKSYFFGLGLNLSASGRKYVLNLTNPGIFIKKQF